MERSLGKMFAYGCSTGAIPSLAPFNRQSPHSWSSVRLLPPAGYRRQRAFCFCKWLPKIQSRAPSMCRPPA